MGFHLKSTSYQTQTSGEGACMWVFMHISLNVNSRCASPWTDIAPGIVRTGHKKLSSIVVCMCLHECVLLPGPASLRRVAFGTSPRRHTQAPLDVLVLATVHNVYQYVQYIKIKWTCWTFNALYSTCQHYLVQTALVCWPVWSQGGQILSSAEK